MKILRIILQNLNSLKGEHLIDFTVPPLSDNPLYAIVGPTGAGKTTILDAITLALYGQTERNKKETDRVDGVNSVMTHGTAECRAELEYETQTGRYRSVWRRHRAHRKSSGKLVKSQQELSKYNTDTGEYDILATKKKQVARLTEQVVGLNYERFVRSVMLTQGAFDRFLKSDAGDKSAILEQITGTEIYRQLSEGAYRRHKQAREACDRATAAIGGALPLSALARQELEAEVAQANAALIPITADLTALGVQLTAYAQVAELEGINQAREQQQTEATERWELGKHERDRLAASDRLEPLRAALTREASLAADEQSLLTALVTVTRDREVATEQLKGIKQRLTDVREKLAGFRAKEPEREKKLAAAEVIEQELRTVVHDRERLSTQLTRHLRSRQELAHELSQTSKSVAELRQSLGGLTAPEIETETQGLERDLPTGEQRLREIERGLEYHRKATQRKDQLAILDTLRVDRTAVEQQRDAAEKAVQLAEIKVDLLRTQRENARLRASLEEHRRHLAKGQPCPLCGALEHPYRQEDADNATAADALLRQLTEAQNHLTEAENTHISLVKKVLSLDGRYQQAEATVAELDTALAEVSDPPVIGASALEEDRNGLLAALDKMGKRLQRLRHLRPLLPELRAREVSQTTLTGRQSELGETLRLEEEELAALEARFSVRTSEKEGLIGEFSSAECRRRLRTKAEALQEAVTAAEKQGAEADTALATLVERAARLTERREELGEALESVRTELNSVLDPLGMDRKEARNQLLPPQAVTPLRQRLQLLDRERETAATLSRQAAAELAAAREKVEDLNAPEQLRQQQAALTDRVTAINQGIGAVKNQLTEDDNRLRQVQDLRSELDALERERDRWAEMNELIGSADGKKFRSFAQSITLQRLVRLGNHHLETISPRYRMIYAPPAPGDKEELELEILDTYMNDNRRTMSTLSGGESFLVSLALALALADLAGGKQLIQSLFIDEGFGTLDGKTLDQAMITLEQLQAQGKTVGIISHVQQLRERVHCQIRLEPRGDGFSRIELTS